MERKSNKSTGKRPRTTDERDSEQRVEGFVTNTGPSTKNSLQDAYKQGKINLNQLRRVCRQPVGDANTGLVWDSFELPKEFEGEELPPLPPTPTLTASQSPTHQYVKQLTKRKEYVPAKEKKASLTRMNELVERMRRNAESRRKEYEDKGIRLAYTEGEEMEDPDEGSDLDGSFVIEYSPSPTVTERVTGNDSNQNLRNLNRHPSQPHEEAASDDSVIRPYGSKPLTPTGRRQSNQLSPFCGPGSEPKFPRRTRLSFSEEVELCLKTEEDEDEWPDDEMMSQVDLNLIQIASGASSSSENSRNSATMPSNISKKNSCILGEGFEDSDSSDDLLFSQLNY